MKKSTKIGLASLATLAVLGGIGGIFMVKDDFNSRFEAFVKARRTQEAKEAEKKQKKSEESKQGKDNKENKQSTHDKQLAYVKEHQQEIVDYVKSQNSKVESVQINWNDVRWSEGGLIKTEYYINIYGHINNIDESSWGVGIPLKDDGTVEMDKMFLGSQIRVGGDLL